MIARKQYFYILTGLLFAFFNHQLLAQIPVNDDCINSVSITPTSSCIVVAGTINNATQSLAACSGTIAADVWYKFTALSSGNRIQVSGNTFDAAFQILDGSCTGTNVACVDANSTGVSETYYNTNFIVGSTYYVRVFSFNSVSSTNGSFQICIQNIPPPVNDDCINSVSITPTSSCTTISGTLNGATQSMAACSGTIATDVWYMFTALSSGNRIQVSGNTFDAAFQVLDGSCTGTNVACIDANNMGVAETYYNYNFVAGSTYYIRVFSRNSVSSTNGSFQICIQNIPPPVNDNCINSTSITPTSSCTTINGTLNGASQSMAACSGTLATDVWYMFTALSTGNKIQVSGNTFDAAFQVLDGSCTGTNVACVDANSTGVSETYTNTAFVVGSTYYVRVFSYNSVSSINGSFQICVQAISPLVPVSQFTTNSFQICEGACVGFSDLSQNSPTTWNWQFQGASITSSSNQNPTNICYNSPGSYTISLTATNGIGSSISTKTISVLAKPIVNAITSNSIICAGQSSTLTVSGATSYSWNTGAVSSSILITPSVTTSYSVIGIDNNGCANTGIVTQNVNTCTGIITPLLDHLNIYPNPFLNEIIVKTEAPVKVKIINTIGETVEVLNINKDNTIINTYDLLSGLYYIELVIDNERKTMKMIKL